MAEPRIKVGIIGLGRSGRDIHIATLLKLPAYEIVAVSDALEDRLAQVREWCTCRAYTDYQMLLADPDVELVVVATTSFSHCTIALQALAAGKHVLVEKPMATHLADADRMIAAAQASGKLLTVFQNRRFDPDLAKVREVIGSGCLGEIVHIRRNVYDYSRRTDWQALQKYGGGMLNNLGAHILDQVMLLMNYDVRDIFADVKRTVSAGDAEDHLKVVLRNDKLTLDLELFSCCAYPEFGWQVMGTRGTLTESNGKLRYRYVDVQDLGPLPEINDIPSFSDYTYPHEDIPWHEVLLDILRVDLNVVFYSALMGSLRGSEPLVVKPEQVRYALDVVERIRAQTERPSREDIDLKSMSESSLERDTTIRLPVDPVLAIHGGRPVCQNPLPSKWHGIDLIGQAELDQLQEVIRTKTPFRHYGPTRHTPAMAETLERRVAEMFGVKYALAVTSGSAALSCALTGLGVGPGDEVILPAFAWISCYNAIVLAGALPVFCDIDDSLTVDPADFERKITATTKALLLVHYQGGSANLNVILEIARRHNIKVIEDNAQSAGAHYRSRYLGSFGDVGILSFQAAKIMTSGEGGMLLTNDATIFERAVRFHDLGFLRPTFDAQIMRQTGVALTPEEQARRQFNVDATFAGNQYRMNELSAAVALAQLARLDWIVERCHSAWDVIQRQVAAEEIGVSFRRTNDYDGDAGITLFVDLGAPERAQAFKAALALEIPNLGPSSHVSNLLAEEYVQAKRMHHPALPPFGPGYNGERVTYSRASAPNADTLPARMVGIGIGPRYTRTDAEIIGDAIIKVYRALFGEG